MFLIAFPLIAKQDLSEFGMLGELYKLIANMLLINYPLSCICLGWVTYKNLLSGITGLMSIKAI